MSKDRDGYFQHCLQTPACMEATVVLVSLPLTGYVLLFLAFVQRNDWRRATVLAATVWGVLITFITEGLNLLQWLTRAGLASAWCVVNIILLIFL